MKHLTRVLFFLLPILTACGDGASSVPVQRQSVSGASVNESQVGASASLVASQSISSSSDLLYVGNQGNNSITVYDHAASGNTAPKYLIAGSKTGITHPYQLSEDAQGNLYVANSASILVFAHGANGNVAPIRVIAGPSTGIRTVETVTVDKTTGKIFATDFADDLNAQRHLFRFPPNSTGNQAPFATGLIGGSNPSQITSDSSGQYIIDSHDGFCCEDSLAGIETFVKQFPDGSQLMSTPHRVSALLAIGIADDPTTKTYLTSSGNLLYRLVEAEEGYGPNHPFNPGSNFIPSPVSMVTTRCAGQLAVAPGPNPNTYLACNNAVYVYANNANGKTPPLRLLSGSATRMNGAYGIYEGP